MMAPHVDRPGEDRPHDLAVPPHRPLLHHHADVAGREQFVRRLFNRTAVSYNVVNTVFSLGTGQRYRRRSLEVAGLKAGDHVLDVAVGTGLVAREACSIVGPSGRVIGLDLSEGMLAQARRALSIGLIQARAEAIPLRDATFDFVTIGYALRHFSELTGVFAEFHRVLKPDGLVLILEIASPQSKLGTAILRGYLGSTAPFVSRMMGTRHERVLMKYYWDTIEACVAPDVILASLRGAGFQNVACRVELGIFRAYTGQR